MKAHTREQIFKLSMKAIEENNLFFINDVVAYLPIGKTTFYELFDATLNETNSYKDEMMAEMVRMLEQNKIKIKTSIRSKLYKSENVTGMLALYRMICTNDERKALNQAYIDHTSDNKGIVINTTESIKDLTDKL